MTALPQTNLLAHESSPYLRQHADNPVHWRPWSPTALAEAAALERPILLSIGYAACHWCHVMAHESFENDAVADVMNRLFVNIKVDREERPDIDQIYMAALTAMGEQGGWPLTIFLTPQGRPFWGGTYFPREPRYGRPGFIQVLEAVARTWDEKRAELESGARTLIDHVSSRLAPAANNAALNADIIRILADSILSSIDIEKGGLRGAPKFPNAPFMEALWRMGDHGEGRGRHREAVLSSLRHMLSGGIYDHVGGGLCRYATDDSWLVPHFEKMLYDNAQLIALATAAYSLTEDELFRIRIEETVGFLAREMTVNGGGFASSLDADSDGEEGLFYLWDEAEIDATLGAGRAADLLSFYQLARPAGWEGKPILHRHDNPALGRADTDPGLFEMKHALLAQREQRRRPGRDDKVLADWNGLAIAALASAARAFGRMDWLDLAEDAFRFVAESEREGRLPHAILGSDRLFPCMSSDYAAMINAAVSLGEASGNHAYVEKARHWLAMLDRWHRDDAGTGYYLTASDASDVPLRIRGDVDEATPSATAQLIRALLRLSVLTSDQELYQHAVAVAEAALGRIAGQRYGQAGIVAAADLVRQPRKLVIVDRPGGKFISQANRFHEPARVDVLLPEASGGSVALPDGTVIDTGTPGGWLCVGQACLPPVFDADELAALLRR